jgi:hypothetical protein
MQFGAECMRALALGLLNGTLQVPHALAAALDAVRHRFKAIRAPSGDGFSRQRHFTGPALARVAATGASPVHYPCALSAAFVLPLLPLAGCIPKTARVPAVF